MPDVLDSPGSAAHFPIRARVALTALAPGKALVVLATTPEATIDLRALAADAKRAFAQAGCR